MQQLRKLKRTGNLTYLPEEACKGPITLQGAPPQVTCVILKSSKINNVFCHKSRQKELVSALIDLHPKNRDTASFLYCTRTFLV